MVLVAGRTRPVCETAPNSARTSVDAGLGCLVSPADGEIRNSYSAVSSSGGFDIAAAPRGHGNQAADTGSASIMTDPNRVR